MYSVARALVADSIAKCYKPSTAVSLGLCGARSQPACQRVSQRVTTRYPLLEAQWCQHYRCTASQQCRSWWRARVPLRRQLAAMARFSWSSETFTNLLEPSAFYKARRCKSAVGRLSASLVRLPAHTVYAEHHTNCIRRIQRDCLRDILAVAVVRGNDTVAQCYLSNYVV